MIANPASGMSSADEFEELPLLIPSWQVQALAEVAEFEGLTVAQFMRRLVNQALAPRASERPSAAW
jgi:hypothetical protein